MSIIEVKDLCKEYKIRHRHDSALKTFFDKKYDVRNAVNHLTFSIEQGQAIGFIGPNGAGKSTTIKMMTGILEPTSGSVRVLGKEPCKYRKENSRQIGVVFGQRSQLWWDLPVFDSFELLARIYDVPKLEYEKRIGLFHEVLSLGEFWKQPVRQLSLGQKMRAEFAASLLHSPQILFLDEPTIGLDVVVKKEIRTLIGEMREKYGTTVILTTHDMKDVEEICQELIMIDHGKIMVNDTVEAIKKQLGNQATIRFVFDSPLKGLDVQGCKVRMQMENIWEIDFDHNVITPNEILMQVAAQHIVVDMSIREPDIEEIIRELYLCTNRIT